MEQKFKNNIMQLGIFICGIFLLLFFFNFLSSGIQIFVQIGTSGDTFLILSGAFSFALTGLTLASFILLIIQNTIKKLHNSRAFGLSIFYVVLITAVLALAMFIVCTVMMPDANSSSVSEILGWGVGTSSQSGFVYTLILMTVLAYLEFWHSVLRKKEISNEPSDISELNTLNEHETSQNLQQNNVDIQNNNLKIKNTTPPVVRTLRKIFYPIIFSCLFLFIVFGSLFTAFISDEGYRASYYTLYKYRDYIEYTRDQTTRDYIYYLNFEVTNTNDYDVTLNFKVTYQLRTENYEKDFSLTIPANSSDSYEITLINLTEYYTYNEREVLEIYYYDTENASYIVFPNNETYKYYFEAPEIAFLSITGFMLVVVVVSSILYGVFRKKALNKIDSKTEQTQPVENTA